MFIVFLTVPAVHSMELNEPISKLLGVKFDIVAVREKWFNSTELL